MSARLASGLVVLALATPASAQVIPLRLTVDPPSAPQGLREHFGVALAARLVRSNDPDERLRGLERAAAIGNPEAISLLVHALRDPLAPGRFDPRALLVIVRGVAGATAQEEVRDLLKENVLDASILERGAAGSGQAAEGADRDARLGLARSIAALALASSPDPRAVDAVTLVARDAGPGQAAAAEALIAFPPKKVATVVSGPWTPALLRLAAQIGDLRVLDPIRRALSSGDPATRAAAFDAASELGDARTIDAARSALKDDDPRVREAAARAFVRLNAADRARAVESLVANAATAKEGARLAELASDEGVTKALAARAAASSDADVRRAAIVALGRSRASDAVRALVELVKDPLLQGDAAEALARSPNRAALASIEALLRAAPTRRLGARAYALRARTRGETCASCTAALAAMARSPDATDRAVGLASLVLLGLRDARDGLADRDASVRRAVAMAALADGKDATRRQLLLAWNREHDALAKRVMAAGLLSFDREGLVPTAALAGRALAGEEDAPLAAMALAARGDPDDRSEVSALLASSDPLVRAHVALGLGRCPDAEATGQLAEAYPFEPDPLVRRAVVLALAERNEDAGAASRRTVLATARRLDPDPVVRERAARAIEGLPAGARGDSRVDVTWVRLVSNAGTPPPPPAYGAVLVRADGRAVPFAFDDDGYALVPIPPGESRLLLAPRLAAYDAPAP